MANKRMFSMDIVDSDAFLDMPQSAQCLYFHMNMRADDDGFVSSPQRLMRMLGNSNDDLKILMAKRFIIPFDNGVCVVKHWRINNTLRKDRHTPTQYVDELKMLEIKENNAYTEGDNYALATSRQPHGNQSLESPKKTKKTSKDVENKGDSTDDDSMATNGCRSIDKYSIDKSSIASDDAGDDEVKKKNQKHEDIVEVIDSFVVVNSNHSRWYANKTQRSAIEHLIKTHGKEQVIKVVNLLPKTNVLPYFPQITTPHQMAEKWDALSNALIRKKTELTEKASNVIL